MRENLKEPFIKIKYQAKKDLAQKIWRAIEIRNKNIAIFKITLFSSIGLISSIVFVPAWKSLTRNLTQSGFYEYFSLIFSNTKSISYYWQELGLSIAESLPTMSIIIIFALIFIFLISLKYVIKQIISNKLSLSF